MSIRFDPAGSDETVWWHERSLISYGSFGENSNSVRFVRFFSLVGRNLSSKDSNQAALLKS